MRVLITGANGQLGRELQRALAAHELRAVSHGELDITDTAALGNGITRFQPAVVVHCAALTDTTRCEREPNLALQVNASGAEQVARACKAGGASMVYVSTNEVFDGTKGTPYLESDEAKPINQYGRSKLEGERRVQALLEEHYVVRTSWLYGQGGDNFVSKVLAWAKDGQLTSVTDEIATPTWARDLASAIARLIEAPRYGVFHFSNSGEASRHEWVREIVKLWRVEANLKPITTADFRASLAPDAIVPPKPPYSVLANMTGADMGIEMRPWRDALSEYAAER